MLVVSNCNMLIFNNVAIIVLLLGYFKLPGILGYVVPDVTFEALKAGGFRVSMPDVQGTKKFGFSANVNEDVSFANAAKISGAVDTPTDGVFIIHFNDTTLHIGDTVNYNVNVTFGRLSFRKGNLVWLVAESDLHESYAPLGPTCRTGTTTINNGQSSCIGSLIIVDNFEGSKIDTSKWTVEQKIPTYEGVTNELNYYHNSDDTGFLKDGVLYLRPIPAQTDEEIRATLDLRDGCTSSDPNQCFHKHKGAFIIPPVRSGRITSKIPFKYGKVEIRAKLPAGEWLVPVVQLQSKEKTSDGFTPKIYIAYSRGNDHLTGPTGDDIGGRVLYTGPVFNSVEPGRSAKLLQQFSTNDQPFSSDYHTYTLEWLPGKMSFYLDSRKYGTIDTSRGFPEYDGSWNTADAPFNKECVISLGVAVGGVGEFPDNYISATHSRPWTYDKPSYTSPFFAARNSWLPTWSGHSALNVEHVKVWAV